MKILIETYGNRSFNKHFDKLSEAKNYLIRNKAFIKYASIINEGIFYKGPIQIDYFSKPVDITIWNNPNPNWCRDYIQNKDLRYVYDSVGGDLYVWDASLATHSSVINSLHLPYTVLGYFYKDNVGITEVYYNNEDDEEIDYSDFKSKTDFVVNEMYHYLQLLYKEKFKDLEFISTY